MSEFNYFKEKRRMIESLGGLNGDFDTYRQGVGTAVAYAWYVWEKGYKGDTIIKWIN